MNPAQILLVCKIGLVGALLLAVYVFGHHEGAKAVQADWDSDKAMRLVSEIKLKDDHAKEVMRLIAEHDATNVKVSTDHDQALQDIKTKYAADVAAVAKSGGLRITSSICPAATVTEATSNGGHHDQPAATVALPEQITNDLLSLAREADETLEQARACQAWIRQNGFYGVPIPSVSVHQ